MTTHNSERTTVIRNIIKKYGMAKAKSLISALEHLDSGEEIARDYGVSRERVRQWKHALGATVQLYQVHPEVLAVLHRPLREQPA